MTRSSDLLRVRVPGSTSNLGPGFDALGLAVDRTLTATWRPGEAPLRVQFGGTLAGLDPERDLVSRTLARALDRSRESLGGRLELHSTIPVARGLGSSAAARVAGLGLAWAHGRSAVETAVAGPEGRVRERLIGAASRSEGHPDNVVPSVVGGFVAATLDADRVTWTSLPLSPAVGLVFAAPGVEVETEAARRVLPHRVDHDDAVANGARLALLLAGLARADAELVARGLEDRLHVPWRWPLVPGADAAAAAAREAGAWGVTLSGSGSGLLAFTDRDRAAPVARAMDAAFAEATSQPGRAAFPLRPAPLGLAVERAPDDDGAGSRDL